MIFAFLGGILATALLYGVGTQAKSASREIRWEKAFFIAEAGVERTKSYLRTFSGSLDSVLIGSDNTENTADDGLASFGASTNFGRGTFQIKMWDNVDTNASLFVDADDTVVIRSTGTFENATRVIEVTVRVLENNYPPPTADGAVAVYGTNTAIDFNGVASIISGQDWDVPAVFDCNGLACAGTLTTNELVPGVFSTEYVPITPNTNLITGGIVSNGVSQFATNYWQDEAEYLIPQASITLPGGTYAAETDLGTRTVPKITVVSGSSTITSNLDGAGVLIIMSGVDVILAGNFHYEGIIILMGDNTFDVQGTARLFGSLTTTSQGVDIQIKGTPEIVYSTAALKNLKNLKMSPRPLSVVSWQEIK